MANYPRSCIHLASLLEGSKFQGATTLWTSSRYLLHIRIYSAGIQVALQDVTINLGIFMDIWIRARTMQAISSAVDRV
jgi:hypothetical protein